MSQSRSAEGVPSGALAAQRTAVPVLARWNRRVASLLIALVAIPAMLALALTGLWVTDQTHSAGAYGQVGRLAALGQQVTGLAQAMAAERSGAAAFISGGRPAARLAALRREYAITDGRAARVRRLVSDLGQGYPAQTRAGVAQAAASIARLPGLRRQAVHSQASALAVIAGYSAAISGLLAVNDGIGDLSGNATLITGVRALGSLSRMIDHASQQQAILDVALAAGRFGPGALTALTTAQAQQASDLASFRGSATPEESWALTKTLAGPAARQAQAVEQQAIAAGNGALALGPRASQQWSAGMSYAVGWMSQAEQRLAAWVTADAQALQRGAMQSAMVIGGAGLGVLALVLLGTVFAARSVARRLGRLDTATLESAGAPLPGSAGSPLVSASTGTLLPSSTAGALQPGSASAGAPPPSGASAVSARFAKRNHALLERLLRLIDSSELHEDDPERLASLFEMDHLATRIWRNSDSALVLAGHETPRPAEPLALVDVLRAAASEIEEYGRVVLDAQRGVGVSGSAATDTVHLVAELLENATKFSAETTQVIVSGHAVIGGGALVTIADGGPGIPEEELRLLNRLLASPSLGDMTDGRHMGMLAAALLAARHGITVTLGMPPDGGSTVEVYLPAALISLDALPSAWQGRAGEAALARASAEAGAGVAGPPAGPGPQPGAPTGPDTDAPEAVPLLLGAPLPSAAPGTPPVVTEPDPLDAEPEDGPPIFESVRSGYLHAFGRDLLRFGEQQAGHPPVPWPVRPPASWGNGSGHAAAGPPAAGPPAAGPPAAGRPAFSGPPQRTPPPHAPQPGQARSAAPDGAAGDSAAADGAAGSGTAADGALAHKETPGASVAESAEAIRAKLAGFQRGSRRARTVARMNGRANGGPSEPQAGQSPG